jgi:type II secretory pathway component GspD/PulD (secretin)
VQHYTLSVTGDQREAEIKLGSRIPINVGGSPSSDVQYLDIGLDIEASLREFSNGLELYSRVEQSSVAAPTSPLLRQPVIRNSSLKNTTLLTPGKSVMLGSLDEPGSTDHLDVEVSLEPVQ